MPSGICHHGYKPSGANFKCPACVSNEEIGKSIGIALKTVVKEALREVLAEMGKV